MCKPTGITFNPATDEFASGSCENRYKLRADVAEENDDIQYANNIPVLGGNHAYV